MKPTIHPEEHTLVLIEDDTAFRNDLSDHLSDTGYEVISAEEGKEGIGKIKEHMPDLVLTDLKMPEVSGMEVLKWLQEQQFQIPVILITAYGKRSNAIEALENGAFGYIQKPFKVLELEFKIRQALSQFVLERENEVMERKLSSEEKPMVWGKSSEMQELKKKVQKLSSSVSTVMIRGESGVGKEMVARELHRNSERSDQTFVAVNCAALSAGLLESELFGHEKGAFTGADRQRIGRFELAHKGTILLDEISEIEPDLQAKILRVLEEKSFERIGSSQTRSVDVRVLATSNRNLETEVEEGNFRKDLYYRLQVVPLEIPPLRERREDIPVLARHFRDQYSEERGREQKKIPEETMALFKQYDWPGNVRELKNIVERSLVLGGDGVLNPGQIRSWLDDFQESSTNGGSLAGVDLETLEKEAIQETLSSFEGHRRKTAEALGITERTLRKKIKEWSLEA